MKEEINIQEIIDNLPIVNNERNYWLVRTSSGDNYEEFVENGFVAIGWNEITLSDLKELKDSPKNKELEKRIKSKVNYDGNIDDKLLQRGILLGQSKAIGQLMKFAYEIKRGDVVIIPSKDSDFLSFGEVLSTPVFLATDAEMSGTTCSFRKRKSVSWIKTNVSRQHLDSNLYRFILAHQTINNVTHYSDYINSTLFDFYTINGESTLVLRVKKETKLDAYKVGMLYSDLIYFIKDFSEFNGQEVEEDSLSVKFDLQSPGTIILIGTAVIGMVAIGLFTVLAGGEGGFKYNKETGFEFNFKSNSFLDKLSDFLDRKADRAERLNSLAMGLQYLEVAQNKNLKSLAKSEIKDPIDISGNELEG